MRTRSRAIPLLALALVSGCIAAFRANRDQFKERMRGSRFAAVEHKSIDHDVEALATLLESKSIDCFSTWTDMSSAGRNSLGQMEAHAGRQRYNATLERKADGVVEYSIRIQDRPRPVGVPKEGYYMFAVDLVPEKKGRTAVTRYLPTTYFKSTTAALQEWTEGRDAPCPDLSKGY